MVFGAEIGLPYLYCGWPKNESPSADARLVVVEQTLVLIVCRELLGKPSPKTPLHCFLDGASTATPGQAGLPAEFKHINKRRKRNLQGFP